MRSTWLASMISGLALLGCGVSGSGDSGDTSGTSESGTSESGTSESGTSESGTSESGTDGGTDTDAPPLSNGPSGLSVMQLGCAPNDGLAWDFEIGRGGGCDMAQPDPDAPYVSISVYDGVLLGDPIGMTIEWTDWNAASGVYWPAGENGATEMVIAGSFHIDSWDGMPAIGTTITGWYTLSLEVGEDIGGSFEATYCGGDPLCG